MVSHLIITVLGYVYLWCVLWSELNVWIAVQLLCNKSITKYGITNGYVVWLKKKMCPQENVKTPNVVKMVIGYWNRLLNLYESVKIIVCHKVPTERFKRCLGIIKQLVITVLDHAYSCCYSWSQFYMWIASQLLYKKIGITHNAEEHHVIWLKKLKIPRDVQKPNIVIWVTRHCHWTRFMDLFGLVSRRVQTIYDNVPTEEIKRYLETKFTKTRRTTDSLALTLASNDLTTDFTQIVTLNVYAIYAPSYLGTSYEMNLTFVSTWSHDSDSFRDQFIGSLQRPSCNFIALEEKKPVQTVKGQDNKTIQKQSIDWSQPYFDWAEHCCSIEEEKLVLDEEKTDKARKSRDNNTIQKKSIEWNQPYFDWAEYCCSIEEEKLPLNEEKTDKALKSRDNNTTQKKSIDWNQPYFDWAKACG